jgi:hypothetical protein
MAFAATVIGALRRFLPDFLRVHPVGDRARRRAVWALTHCRTATMGGHVHACEKCGTTHFAFHSCNHRSCPQCGAQDTAEWVERELAKRIGAPYFMVTFTLPQELRALFFTPSAKAIHEVFFAAASEALSATLAHPRWLGAHRCGFTMILHTWNQRLHFHPHIHCIVPGAGFDREGRVVRVKSPGFLVPQPVLRATFRHLFEQKLHALRQRPEQAALPGVEPSVWKKDWGVHLQPFGDGQRIIQYLGTYVCRTAISDARILAVSETTVTFSWKDRAHGNAKRTETISGVEFVSRYLRHVLPIGLRAIRRYGYCHPAAKIQRERLAFHTGIPLNLDAEEPPVPKPGPVCHCCKQEMAPLERILARWKMGRDPPQNIPCPT